MQLRSDNPRATGPGPTATSPAPSRRGPALLEELEELEQPEVPDVVEVAVPAGGRVIVVSDLHLTSKPTPTSTVVTTELAQHLERWIGPGVLVLAGDVVELLAGSESRPASALRAHRRFADAIRAFSSWPSRRVIYLPGNHDGRIAWDATARRDVVELLGADVALAAELVAETGRGPARVRVEHGHRFDPANAFADPREPLDTPLGHHLVRDVLPALTRARRPWLADADLLSDPAEVPSFVASRLFYRRVVRHLAWLAVPLGLALAGVVTRWLLFVAAIVAADVALVIGVMVVLAHRTWSAVCAAALCREAGHDNDAARQEAAGLARDGVTGLITGHTHRPELTDLGSVFFANTGCGADVVVARPARLGLPPTFVTTRCTSWVELEAGAELHVRLLHAASETGTRLVERLATRPTPPAHQRPEVVAVYPGGASWPVATSTVAAQRRVRRIGSVAIAAAGLVNVVSALTPPLENRLQWVRTVVPLAIPQAADALVASAGVALMLLARGVHRGQRRAWALAVALLAASVVFHVAKGVDVEESVLAAAAAAYLVVHRRSFRARGDHRGWRRACAVAGVGAVTATAAGAFVARAWGAGPPVSTADAVAGAAERLVGVTTVHFGGRVDSFLTPSLAAVGLSLVVVAAWAVLRPAVARDREDDGRRRARDIVATYGHDTLAYFALRDDKSYFFHGESVVAYALFGSVCLVSPDPVGPEHERDEVWRAFHRFADDRAWSVAVLGAGESWLPVYRRSGMRDLYVGDEAIVDCRRFELDGGRAKGLRQAVNRIARNGYRVEFFDPAQLDPELQEQLRAMAGDSRRGEDERGFSMTLGRLFDPDDDGLLLAVAFGPDGHPAAFCQYVPAPDIDGYSLDVMRRDTGQHPNGVTDFVVVETIRHLREAGQRGLALNFATMRAVLAGESSDTMGHRLQRWLLRQLSGSMQIESLWRYNDKFDPDWRPRYAVYDVLEHMPVAALAVARAESFSDMPVVGRLLASRN